MLLAELNTVPETPGTVMPPPRPDTVTPFAPASDAKHEVEALWQLEYALVHSAALAYDVGM